MDVPERPELIVDGSSGDRVRGTSDIAAAFAAAYEACFQTAGDRRHLMEQATLAWPILTDALNELFGHRRLERDRLAAAAGPRSAGPPRPASEADVVPALTVSGEVAVAVESIIRTLRTELALALLRA